ncbi:MAG: DUF4142 domain-containing protein [bacterium]
MRSSSRRFTRVSPLLLAVATVAAAIACHRGPRAASTGPAAPAAPQLSDGNVVAIVLAANNTDLSYARLVPSRTSNAQVKTFATLMITDHTILNTRANDIAASRGIVAEDNAASLDFRDHSAQRRDILRELQGAAFDSTYIANEIQYHQELIAALDNLLIPYTRNAELREFVSNLKPAVSAHLAHAERVRASLAARK